TLSRGRGPQVTLSGQVTDEFPAGRTVLFSGPVQGTVLTDPQGRFTFTANATARGHITADVSDDWDQHGYQGIDFLPPPPHVTDFGGTEGSGGVWTFTGHVAPEYAGTQIQLGGLPSLQGQTATVQEDGSFTLVITLTPGEEGTATAVATDWWGQSDEAWA